MHQSLSRLHLLRRKANFQDFSTTLSARIKNQQTKSNDITLFLTLQIMPPYLVVSPWFMAYEETKGLKERELQCSVAPKGHFSLYRARRI